MTYTDIITPWIIGWVMGFMAGLLLATGFLSLLRNTEAHRPARKVRQVNKSLGNFKKTKGYRNG